jgi:hypothetical protein
MHGFVEGAAADLLLRPTASFRHRHH